MSRIYLQVLEVNLVGGKYAPIFMEVYSLEVNESAAKGWRCFNSMYRALLVSFL